MCWLCSSGPFESMSLIASGSSSVLASPSRNKRPLSKKHIYDAEVLAKVIAGEDLPEGFIFGRCTLCSPVVGGAPAVIDNSGPITVRQSKAEKSYGRKYITCGVDSHETWRWLNEITSQPVEPPPKKTLFVPEQVTLCSGVL